MSKYDKDTKFYWLQLKEDFFDDDAISWLEEQQPKGKEYALFYLKLCLKSLKTNGVLIRKVGNILIPYDNKKLAELTKMDFDTVTVAMGLLRKIGLVKVLENGEIYIEQLENLIGVKSKGALKKQQQRQLKEQDLLGGGQRVDKCPPEIDIEIESELDIEIESDIENNVQNKTEILDNEFETLWTNYPNKQGKASALKSYLKARIKDKVDYDTIKTGLEKYLIYCHQNKDWYKPKNGSTWFNQQSWNDEYPLKQTTTKDVAERINLSSFFD